MENARKEMELLVKCLTTKVKCAQIINSNEDGGDIIILKVGYSENDWSIFLKRLDFNYDSGYGSQELYGIVWLEDDTWFSRDEYDGKEWWVHNSMPEIPEELL